MSRLQDIAAEIPPSLRVADDLMHKYGRWCKDRHRLHRCGSAERAYRSPQDDQDREPKAVLMHTDLVTACQKAFQDVAYLERRVLDVLYIPKRIPVEVRLRQLRIPPRLSRERHLNGLRMFDNRFKVHRYSLLPDKASVRADALWRAAASVEQSLFPTLASRLDGTYEIRMVAEPCETE